MRPDSWKWIFTWEGHVQRLQYFLAGAILVAVKYVIDLSVASRFGEAWRIWNYFLPSRDVSLFELGHRQPELYGILWASAIPFFWIGIALTLRRLRDAGKPARWIFLFFVPLANLMLFLWLSLAPSTPAVIVKSIANDDLRRTMWSRGAVLGIVLAVVPGLALVTLSTRGLAGYAWGLFLGVPFLTGFVASWFLNAEAPQSRSNTIKVSTLTTFLIGLALLGLGAEGLLCLLMALPLALPFSIAGGLVAREVLHCRNRPSTPPTFAACLAILPRVMFAEPSPKLEPPVLSVPPDVTIVAP